ncbi:hypothetical protein Ait01nite_094000 [Actinoplanes italicus]|nr:hypothetical protein Ait01nite_094000 [Actinoplanes italicus]
MGLGRLDRRPEIVGVGHDDVGLDDAPAREPQIDALQHQEPGFFGGCVQPDGE